MLCEMSPRVLIIEDDDMIAAPLIRTLEREGYDVERLAQGLPALDRVSQAPAVDLVLLDLGLPDVDGLEVCRRLREQEYAGGIVILTARDGELDRVVGLDVGADDYIAKPFGLSELLARTRALLRRSGLVAAAAPVTVNKPVPASSAAAVRPPGEDPLRVDLRARRVTLHGAELVLTAKEFDLLALLDSERGAVLTRERLMDEVWDENWFGSTKTLDATVGRLRQKLEERGRSVRIATVRGVGFRLESDPPDA